MFRTVHSRYALLSILLEKKHRLIVVEGARGSGKTTLVKFLSDELRAKVYSTGGNRKLYIASKRTGAAPRISTSLDITQGSLFVLEYLIQVGLEKPVVFDRSYHSSYVFQDRFSVDPICSQRLHPQSRMSVFHERLLALDGCIILKKSNADTLNARIRAEVPEIPLNYLEEEQDRFQDTLLQYARYGGSAYILEGEE